MALASDNRFRIAIDIGGTFTDIALLTDAGLIHQSKISSTPSDPSVAVIEGVGQLLAELSIPPGAIAEVLHGTTVGSNTILQRKGARPVSSPPAAFAMCWRSAASACPTCST